MDEIWKPVVGYEGLYEVSNFGRVRSLRRNKILKLKNEVDGYIRVTLCNGGTEKLYQVHRLVAQAFIPNPDNLPQINHKDEVKSNNIVTNLEWCTVHYNNTYGTRLQRVRETGLKNGTISGIDISERRKKYYQEHKEWFKNYKKNGISYIQKKQGNIQKNADKEKRNQFDSFFS